MTLALVWAVSALLVGVGIFVVWVGDRRRATAERPPDAERFVPQELVPHPRLLVPWPSVRSSKLRLGVDPAALRTEEGDHAVHRAAEAAPREASRRRVG